MMAIPERTEDDELAARLRNIEISFEALRVAEQSEDRVLGHAPTTGKHALSSGSVELAAIRGKRDAHRHRQKVDRKSLEEADEAARDDEEAEMTERRAAELRLEAEDQRLSTPADAATSTAMEELVAKEARLVLTLKAESRETARLRAAAAEAGCGLEAVRRTLDDLATEEAQRDRVLRGHREDVEMHHRQCSEARAILDEAHRILRQSDASSAEFAASRAREALATHQLVETKARLRAEGKKLAAETTKARLQEKRANEAAEAREIELGDESEGRKELGKEMDDLAASLAELRAKILTLDEATSSESENDKESPGSKRVGIAFAKNEALRRRASELRREVAEIEELQSDVEELQLRCEDADDELRDLERRRDQALQAARRDDARAQAADRETRRAADLAASRDLRVRRERAVAKREQVRCDWLRRKVDRSNRRRDELEVAAMRDRAALSHAPLSSPASSTTKREIPDDDLDAAVESWDDARRAAHATERRRDDVADEVQRITKEADEAAVQLEREKRETAEAVAAVEAELESKRRALRSARAQVEGRLDPESETYFSSSSEEEEEDKPHKNDNLVSAVDLVAAVRDVGKRDAQTLDRLLDADLDVRDQISSLHDNLGHVRDQIARQRAHLDSYRCIDAYHATKAAYLSWLRESRSTPASARRSAATPGSVRTPHSPLAVTPETTPTARMSLPPRI